MKCPSCGAENPDYADYCCRCAAQMISRPGTKVDESPGVRSETNPEALADRLNRMIVMSIVVVVAAFLTLTGVAILTEDYRFYFAGALMVIILMSMLVGLVWRLWRLRMNWPW